MVSDNGENEDVELGLASRERANATAARQGRF